MAIKKLEYCLGNLQNNGTHLVYDKIKEEFPQLTQNRWACLGNCSECYKRPFVLIDEKEILSAETPEELLDQVLNKIGTLA
ncbi:DUF1450 domain-containing protein [Effusibacillus lacus]|uniref:UDP-N-acetylmuramoylalanine--D-glutamate ligase n=1 Tax=Effusibacillus lacus TaxID=1348429 RepID=A0A292YC59_9BACL|nr:DUF1450 domain-containing protein [Effusibacillus lacus]TCS74346.1 uncharacterized protein YuzB (UPF0349 family) [Effusibacillus lacus]GAX88802.1 hypothetical protein EFBL_0416 [Effusibacillus lacus]